MKVKDTIIEQLSSFGVKNIYGYAGDTVLEFFSALENSPISLYTTKHESTAGLMASAHAKLTDQLGVCIAHSGPGTANIINGIADAASDRTPLLLITGQVPSYNLHTNYKQYMNHLQLTSSFTQYSARLTHPEAVVDLLYKAMTMALTRGGVSHLVIPMDLWNMETSAQPREYPLHLNLTPQPDSNDIEKAAMLLNKAKKPVILYGRGAKTNKNELKMIAEKLKAPLINTLPASGVFSFDDKLVMGGLGHGGNPQASELLKQADLVLIIGATWWPMDYTPRQPKVIQIDACKENIASTHPVEIGIYGDIKSSLNKILPQIQDNPREEWSRETNNAKKTWLESLKNNISPVDNPVPPEDVIKALSKHTSENEIIALDSGDNVIWFSKYFSSYCQDVLISGTWRTMGFSLPAALTSKINYPDNPVTAITGDGGLAMVMGELLTAVKYNLNVRIVLLNNGTLAMEKNRMLTADLSPHGVDLLNPDFVELAHSCGLEGIRVEKTEDLEQTFLETKSLDKPVLIDIPIQAAVIPGTKLS